MPSKLVGIKAALEKAGLKIVRIEDDSKGKWSGGADDYQYVSIDVVFSGDPNSIFSGDLQPELTNPRDEYGPAGAKFTEKIGTEKQTIVAAYPEEVLGDERFVDAAFVRERDIERVIWVSFHRTVGLANGTYQYDEPEK